jgi:hypothetical protein
MCNCKEQSELIDISGDHEDFKAKLKEVDTGDRLLLMSCPDCNQLWKVDNWGDYEPCYAVKILTPENWVDFDSDELIKNKMIENRGGLSGKYCLWSKCEDKQVNGETLCIEHLWKTGTRV